MRYNQNQKIEQVQETTLIVGVDIAKHKHVARAQDSRGIELSGPLTFDNTRSSFMRFLTWIRSLMNEYSKLEAVCGIEPTGHYWKPLAQFLRQHGIKIVVVNPLHVKKSKELDDNSPTKNDIKDAKVIAQLVKDGRYSEPNIPTEIYAELRVGMNMRDRLTEDLRRVKGRIDNWLDRYFPEFNTVFTNWDGKAALMTLENFPLPQEIVAKGVDNIVGCWKEEVKRAVGRKRALLLVEAAKSSIGLTEGLTMARQELLTLLAQYRMLEAEIQQLMNQLENIIKEIPGTQEMMTIPGVGLVTIAGFLAEVGNLEDYHHPRQIQKLAGLNLKENSSGQHKGRTRITKRGRPRLRALLYKCIMPLVAKNPEFKALHHYYTTRQQNPLKKKQSLIALCCKLIRVLFAINKNKTPYDGRKLLKNSPVYSLEEAA
jgi:transposase